MYKIKTILILFLLLSFYSVISQTQKTGKISGKIVNIKNNEPLPFVNIGILGTNLGTSSDENGKFRNTDEEGEMIVDILFKQGGMVVVPTNGIINIRSTNRGYTFGLRIQDGGFGIDSQHTEKDGIGSSLRKVVSYAMAKGIRQIIESKNPHISKRQSTPHRIFQQQPLRRNRIPSRSYYDSTANITQEEEDFIRSLRNHSNQM